MQTAYRRRFIGTLFAAAMAIMLGALPAAGQTLDELRSSGVVGERYDGLLVVRDTGASAKIRAIVADINGKRQQIYEQRAKEQGVPADQVGRVYAQEIFQQAPAGTWFLGADGRWTRK